MIETVVSGGQTGADRAALDWALARGLGCGGWCPRGRLAEDGEIPASYPLRETPSEGYSRRTEWNVRDSEATVIFSLAPELSGGSAFTKECAREWNRPCLHLSQALAVDAAGELASFVDEHFVRILNVAGPRDSTEPGVGAYVAATLEGAFPAQRC